MLTSVPKKGKVICWLHIQYHHLLRGRRDWSWDVSVRLRWNFRWFELAASQLSCVQDTVSCYLMQFRKGSSIKNHVFPVCFDSYISPQTGGILLHQDTVLLPPSINARSTNLITFGPILANIQYLDYFSCQTGAFSVCFWRQHDPVQHGCRWCHCVMHLRLFLVTIASAILDALYTFGIVIGNTSTYYKAL